MSQKLEVSLIMCFLHTYIYSIKGNSSSKRFYNNDFKILPNRDHQSFQRPQEEDFGIVLVEELCV